MPERKLVCLDFDGCLSNSTRAGYNQDEFIFEPVNGVGKWIEETIAHHDLIIFSARELSTLGKQNLCTWFKKYHLPEIPMTNIKPPQGHIFVDDRAYQFTGTNFPSVDYISRFTPWNRVQKPDNIKVV